MFSGCNAQTASKEGVIWQIDPKIIRPASRDSDEVAGMRHLSLGIQSYF